MKNFEDRQKGFEAEFQRNQELTFRIGARRNKLFGLWVAEKLGLPSGEPAETYAKSVVEADFQRPGDSDVIEKVQTDLTAKGISLTETELRVEFQRAAVEAQRQLQQQ